MFIRFTNPLALALVLIACTDTATDSGGSEVGRPDPAAEDAGSDPAVDSAGTSDAEPDEAFDFDAGDAGPDASEGPDAGAEPYAGYVSEVYADPGAWICHPTSADDVCDEDLAVTEVAADGSVTIVSHPPAAHPAVDCFYVYPTASADQGGNSDMSPGAEEIFITRTQAGPFNTVCRVFAPAYRQVTLTALLGMSRDELDFELAYADVLDAWKHYVAVHSEGRGFILIGHSQGTSHLRRLIAEEVEPDARLADRMIAAYLVGATVEVPPGEDVGGTFRTTSACRTSEQVGCIVSYASYRAEAPPPAGSFFARASLGYEALCNHPASLDGGRSELRGRFPVRVPGLFAVATGGSTISPYDNPGAHDPIDTPFFSTPGLVEGGCVRDGGAHFLAISMSADPSDPRSDEPTGELSPEWGLHLVDHFLVTDDFVNLAASQAAAWLARAEVPE